MTTYAYNITLTDSEVIMLKEALLDMMMKCEREMPDGRPKAPYWAHKHSAESVLEKLYGNVQQTSGNNFRGNI